MYFCAPAGTKSTNLFRSNIMTEATEKMTYYPFRADPTDTPKWRRYKIISLRYEGAVHDHPRVEIKFDEAGTLQEIFFFANFFIFRARCGQNRIGCWKKSRCREPLHER